MIADDTKSFLSSLRSIWMPLLTLFLLDLAVTIAYMGLGWKWLAPNAMPLALLSGGLAVFLGFRNNTAYARWWEARTLWGAATNHSRSFARLVTTHFTGAELQELRAELTMLQVAWAHTLRCSLRRQEMGMVLERLLEPEDIAAVRHETNVPYEIQILIGQRLAQAQKSGLLDAIALSNFNNVLNDLANAQGGLERIRNTPMPRQYALFPSLFVSVYCLMLPFGIVPDLQWLTPLVSTMIGFLFLALDAAGSDLENPFDRTAHDVPMSAITRNIEINLREAIDCPNSPPPPKRLQGILR